MKPQSANITAADDQAESRARKVADSILADLGQLSTEQSAAQDDDDRSGAYARAVLEEFKKGVAAAVSMVKPTNEGK